VALADRSVRPPALGFAIMEGVHLSSPKATPDLALEPLAVTLACVKALPIRLAALF